MNTDETNTNEPEAAAPAANPQPEHETPSGASASTEPVVNVGDPGTGSPNPSGASASSEQGDDPPPPARAEIKRHVVDDEEPGDDIGNRLPGARVPDDIGNRRRGGPQGGPRGGGQHGGGQHGGGQHGGGQQGGTPRPRPAPAPAQVAPGAPTDGAPTEGVPTEGASVEGVAGEGVAAEGATANGPPAAGEGPAKKRRRRRRRKPGADGAHPQGEGAHGASHQGEEHEGEGHEGGDGDHDAHAEGQEGEAHEGEDAAGNTEHAHGEHAHGEHAQGEHGEGHARRRRGPRGGPAADRDRPAFSIGEEVFGKVSKVTDTAVWIDIAGKATGLFDRRELVDDEPPVEGDQFIATVASTGVRGGMLMLSRLSIILDESRKVLEAAAASGEMVNGFVTGAVKGGLEVDLGGLRAFAPASHVDMRHGADLSYLVGQRLDFVVTQYAKKGRDIVVSRRKTLEEEYRKARAEALTKVEPGSVHRAVVRKVVAWGVFMALPDAGGVEGLVHMSEASHDRGARLNDLFKPGAEMDVKVLNIDDKGKLWLSRRAVVADPWDAVKEKYTVGSRHKGKVARLQPFGAFIELEPGVDGLIHTADLSIKPIEHPQEVVKVGDEIEVVVASSEPNQHRIGLHPAPPPGEEIEVRQRVQPHKIVKVAVAQVTEGGLVVRVLGVTGRGSRGFIPAGHTGTPRGSDLRKEFPLNTQLDAKILEIDPRRGEVKLSIRAVKEDAEKAAYQQYRAGVARDAKFGTFADLMKKTS
jgi:small subunit ribosomal protein S1